MVKIVYFITPKTIAKLSSKALEFLPVVGPTLEFSKKAVKAPEMTDPLSASSRGIGILFNFLKFYHFAGELDTTVFDRLQAEHIEYTAKN